MLGLSRTFSLPLKAGVREGELLRERALQPEGADDPRDEPGMNCITSSGPNRPAAAIERLTFFILENVSIYLFTIYFPHSTESD